MSFANRVEILCDDRVLIEFQNMTRVIIPMGEAQQIAGFFKILDIKPVKMSKKKPTY